MRLRGAWCTDRGSLTESRVLSSTARAFTHHSPIAPRRPRRPRWRRRRTSARTCSMKDTGTTKPWRKASRSRTGCARAPRDRSSSRRRRASDERRTLCRSRPRRPSTSARRRRPRSLRPRVDAAARTEPRASVVRARALARSLSLSRARPRRRRAARADASSLASSRRRQPPPRPSRRWTRSCTADRARSRPWRS